MVRSSKALNHSVGRGILQVIVLTAVLLSSRCVVVFATITDTANQSSFHWLHSMWAGSVTSEDYLLASTMPNLYGSNWPAAAAVQNVGRSAEGLNDDGAITHFGDLYGEIVREPIWARVDTAERVLGMQFETEFVQIASVMSSVSGRTTRDNHAHVGYVSNSRPVYRHPRNTESSIGWI